MKFTENELKALNFLTRRPDENYSINGLSKQIGLTPMGAQKILKRLEKAGMVKHKKMANAMFYQLNFDSDVARKAAELSLFEEIPNPYARAQAKDIERLRPFVRAAVLFGSVLKKGEGANDIDVLVVVEKKEYAAFQAAIKKLQALKPKRIEPVIQSPEDLVHNIKTRVPVMLEIIKTGKILWGQDAIVNALKEAA